MTDFSRAQVERIRLSMFEASCALLDAVHTPFDPTLLGACRLPLLLLKHECLPPHLLAFVEEIEMVLQAIDHQILPRSSDRLLWLHGLFIALLQATLMHARHQRLPEDMFRFFSHDIMPLLFQKEPQEILFCPDLTVSPSLEPPIPIGQEVLNAELKKARGSFQKALLASLREPLQTAPFEAMHKVFVRLHTLPFPARTRTFWCLCARLFLSAAIPLHDCTTLQKLCTKLDLQMKPYATKDALSDALFCELLFLIARCSDAPDAPAPLLEIKEIYALPNIRNTPLPISFIPPPKNTAFVILEMQSLLFVAESAWQQLCTGSLQKRETLASVLPWLLKRSSDLAHTDYARLMGAIHTTLAWLFGGGKYTETLALEVAAAFSLARKAADGFELLDADFTALVDEIVPVLHGFLSEDFAKPDINNPILRSFMQEVAISLETRKIVKKAERGLLLLERAVKGEAMPAQLLEGTMMQTVSHFIFLGQNDLANTFHDISPALRALMWQTADKPTQIDQKTHLATLALMRLFLDHLPTTFVPFPTFSEFACHFGSYLEAREECRIAASKRIDKPPLPAVLPVEAVTQQIAVPNAALDLGSLNLSFDDKHQETSVSDETPQAEKLPSPEIFEKLIPPKLSSEERKARQKISISPVLFEMFSDASQKAFEHLDQFLQALKEAEAKEPEMATPIQSLITIASGVSATDLILLIQSAGAAFERARAQRQTLTDADFLFLQTARTALQAAFDALLRQETPDLPREMISALNAFGHSH